MKDWHLAAVAILMLGIIVSFGLGDRYETQAQEEFMRLCLQKERAEQCEALWKWRRRDR